jgi:hypothetical protein
MPYKLNYSLPDYISDYENRQDTHFRCFLSHFKYLQDKEPIVFKNKVPIIEQFPDGFIEISDNEYSKLIQPLQSEWELYKLTNEYLKLIKK